MTKSVAVVEVPDWENIAFCTLIMPAQSPVHDKANAANHGEENSGREVKKGNRKRAHRNNSALVVADNLRNTGRRLLYSLFSLNDSFFERPFNQEMLVPRWLWNVVKVTGICQSLRFLR